MRIFKKKIKTPWKKFYKKEDLDFSIPDISMYQMLKNFADDNKSANALNYFGKITNYGNLIKEIDRTASALRCYGVRPGDTVTICMPNTPEAIISIYALNKIGAIANVVHPLSAENELKHFLIDTGSVMIIAIDQVFEKVEKILSETKVYKTIFVSPANSMPTPISVGYKLKYKNVKIPKNREDIISWNEFIKKGENYHTEFEVNSKTDTPAVILHSGGTTGSPKGILLSNGNFNAMCTQIKTIFKKLVIGDKILAILPIFHGFGLGVSIHSTLCIGVEIVLIPQFNAKEFDVLVKKHKPTIMTGVPTLYEALTKNKGFEGMDLSFLKYIISGGDSLTEKQNNTVNKFLKDHNCNSKIEQGYGMTESLGAVSLAFGNANYPCTIGIPFPNSYMKIVVPNTQDEVPYGEIGEIVTTGPTVMLGYLNNQLETNITLQKHKDGNIWLHSGDLGKMSKDGVVTYVTRLKRMIISSGYNIYPVQIEQVIESHEAVLKCTVIGIPHDYKKQVAKAYIVLKDGYKDSGKVKKGIQELVEKNLSINTRPYHYEYRESLPTTLIGKVDYKKLEQEALEKKV